METTLLPVASLAGGVLIGLAATAMLGLLGRVAGISGIVGGLLAGFLGAERAEVPWRVAFVAGLVAVGAAVAVADPSAVAMDLDRSMPAVALAGVLVGFGSRLGSGCTSGHGVCGMARGSTRSLVATLTFMSTGMLTAFVVGRFLGGSL